MKPRYCVFCRSTKITQKGIWLTYLKRKVLVTAVFKCRNCGREASHQYLENKKEAKKEWRIA